MHLLFVANFAADTGYAWDTIESVFRRVGERLVEKGHRITIAYAALPNGPPASMSGAPFDFLTFDYERVRTRAGLGEFAALLRSHTVDALYLTDRETWSSLYGVYRRAGVKRIILHDRTSGERTRRGLVSRAIKKTLHRMPWLSADCYIGVSAFVRNRLVTINGTPESRTHLVYNGVDVTRFDRPEPGALHRAIGVPEHVPVVFCSGRAQPYKGIQVVIDAAAKLGKNGTHLEFVYCGDGGYLEDLREQATKLGLDNFHFLGHRRDVPRLLGAANVAVVPSLWAEAFGLTVVEAMVARVPLVATRTGGIPELIQHGETGLLIQPDSAEELANGIARLLANPVEAQAMATRARAIACDRFSLERAAENLYQVVSSQLGEPTAVGAGSPALHPLGAVVTL